uniref:Uncharacterized protein n=1 Tax=Arundo donax TaxID=35708 RepID=A0A0A9A6X1_ARUDO
MDGASILLCMFTLLNFLNCAFRLCDHMVVLLIRHLKRNALNARSTTQS